MKAEAPITTASPEEIGDCRGMRPQISLSDDQTKDRTRIQASVRDLYRPQ
jgi:hypothetical protein